MTVRHGITWLSLLVGNVAGVTAAHAADGIPAFARKYGMRCFDC